MTKLTDALAVRQSALLILRAKGVKKLTPKFGMCLGWTGDAMSILFRTPFQSLARPSARWVMEAALMGVGAAPAFPYGLDIWADGDGKLFNFEWDDRDQCRIVTFHQGGWQIKLENICEVLLLYEPSQPGASAKK